MEQKLSGGLEVPPSCAWSRSSDVCAWLHKRRRSFCPSRFQTAHCL